MKKVLNVLLLIVLPVIYLTAQNEVAISGEKVVIDGQKYYMHTVEQGQTLFSVCKAYKVSEEEIVSINPEIKNKTLKLGQVIKIPVIDELSPDGKYIIYSVKPGDTLYSLCRKYGITEDEFYALNTGIKKNKALKIGQEIKFPVKVIDDKITEAEKDTTKYYYHLVEKGETVYGLTRKYNVSKEEIMAVNPDFDGSKLLVGEVLIIPKKTNIVNDDQHIFIDSLANVNYKDEDSVKVNNTGDKNACDKESWFTHGKNFEIVLLLPFETGANMRNLYNQATSNRDQRLYLITEKMISFYSGCLMAFEKFKTFDVKINVKVYDIGKDNTAIASLIENGKLGNADIIIGPAFRSQIDYLNTNIKNEKAVVLLPFVDDNEILEKYSRNITLKPSTDMVIDAVAGFAALNPSGNYLIIQGTTADQIKIASKYHDALVAKLGSEDNVSIIRFGGKDLSGVKNMVKKDRENYFVLPFNTETSVTNIFLDLFPLKDYEITLIADPVVLDYETIDPSYYSKVKFSYYTGVNVNYSDEETKKLVSDYRDAFLCEPDEYSFMAYDAVSYFVLKLLRHGNNFTQCVETENFNDGVSGHQEYSAKPNFANDSYSDRFVYIFTLQEDFSFKQVFPGTEGEK